MIVIMSACPDCGCFDLRLQKWAEGWKCFKCGLTETDYEHRQLEMLERGIAKIFDNVLTQKAGE